MKCGGMLSDKCLSIVASPSSTPEFLKSVSSTLAATIRRFVFSERPAGEEGVE